MQSAISMKQFIAVCKTGPGVLEKVEIAFIAARLLQVNGARIFFRANSRHAICRENHVV
jgi:hypothetical protein